MTLFEVKAVGRLYGQRRIFMKRIHVPMMTTEIVNACPRVRESCLPICYFENPLVNESINPMLDDFSRDYLPQ